MNSVFLRIYSGLIFALILALILCGLTFTIVSGIRLQSYREASVQIPFRVMAKTLKNTPPSTWQQKLSQWEKSLGVTLHITGDEDLNLRKIWLLRLRQGKLTTRSSSDNTFTAYILINRHTILSGTINSIGQQFLLGSAEITLHWLQRFSPDKQTQCLKELKQQSPYSYAMKLSSLKQADLLPRQMNLLKKETSTLRISAQTDTMEVYASKPAQDQILTIGPWHLFDLYPFRLLMSLCLFVLIAVSIAIYILVRGLNRRICQMEDAAKEIAGGKLDARVSIGVPDSVGRLGMAFNSMARHIQRLLSIQQEMIHGVSHELRTPVARLRFALAMITDNSNQKTLQQQVDEMDKDIEELDTLIDEILTYARLENAVPDLTLKITNIEAIIEQVVEEQQPIYPDLQIRYIKSSNPYMAPYAEVEARYIHRVVQNLVTNACRYANNRIEVQFMHANNLCHIYVEDDGPGIPEKDRERVFSAFSRLDDSRTRTSGGYGLGLSIVRRIMAWHNGEASVTKSIHLTGACFHLSWPRARHETHSTEQ